MPPFIYREHNHSTVFDDNYEDHDFSSSLDTIPIRYKLAGEMTTDTFEDGSSSASASRNNHHIDLQEDSPQPPSILERLLDLNPCTIKVANPPSALFKIRLFSDCGDILHKFKGGGNQKDHRFDNSVDKEKHKESVAESKFYSQLKEHRTDHKDHGFATATAAVAHSQQPLEVTLKAKTQRFVSAVAFADTFAKRSLAARKFFSRHSCREGQSISNSRGAVEESAFRGHEI